MDIKPYMILILGLFVFVAGFIIWIFILSKTKRQIVPRTYDEKLFDQVGREIALDAEQEMRCGDGTGGKITSHSDICRCEEIEKERRESIKGRH